MKLLQIVLPTKIFLYMIVLVRTSRLITIVTMFPIILYWHKNKHPLDGSNTFYNNKKMVQFIIALCGAI